MQNKWSVIDIIHRIPYPTLLISSPQDEVQPISVLPWFKHIPKIKWVELQNSTHLAMYEEPDKSALFPTFDTQLTWLHIDTLVSFWTF